MKFAKNLLTVIFLFAATLSMAGQQAATYRLQPEDLIRIQVYRELEVNALLPIGKDGNVSAPFVGIVRAAGKTTSELEKDLRDLYISKLFIKDPLVSVTIERFRTIKASVGGYVGRPGVYDMRAGDTIVTLLNSGGGTSTDGRADLRKATLRRAGSRELIPIDLYSLIIKGDTSQNYEIEDGDELTVPEETRNRIIVAGQIKNAGAIPYKEPMRLYDVIEQAGGEVPYRSKFSKVQVLRELSGKPGSYLQIEANIVNFLKRGDASQNILLMPGDIVYIPDSGNLDFQQVQQVANIFYILNSFGVKIFN